MFLLLWSVVLGLSLVSGLSDSDEATLQSIKQDVADVKKSNQDILEEVKKIHDILKTFSFKAHAELEIYRVEKEKHQLQKEGGDNRMRKDEDKEQDLSIKTQKNRHSETQRLTKRHPQENLHNSKEEKTKGQNNTSKGIIGEETKQSNQRTLAATPRRGLVMYNIKNRNVAKMQRALVNIPIDSLAYDDQTQRLYWCSIKRGLIGARGKGLRGALIFKSKDIKSNIALDPLRRRIFFFMDTGKLKILCLNLSKKTRNNLLNLPKRHRSKHKLILMLDPSKSIMYALKKGEDDSGEEIMKISYFGKIMSVVRKNHLVNKKTFVFAPDLNKFLFCRTNHELMEMSVENYEEKRIGVCEPGTEVLTYFRRTLWIVGRRSLASAKYSSQNYSMVNLERIPKISIQMPLAAVMTDLEI